MQPTVEALHPRAGYRRAATTPTEKKSGRRGPLYAILTVAFVLLNGGGFWAYRTGLINVPHGASVRPAAAPSGEKVAALVNDNPISELELLGTMNEGVERDIALSRQINKEIAAELAQRQYPQDAKAALRGAEREVLSQLYVSKRMADLRAAVTDADVRSFYDSKIKDEAFTGYRVSFLLSQDPKEVQGVVQAVASGKSADVADKFKPLKTAGDPFVKAAEVPYGLGSVVSRLKPGEYSVPLQVQSGLLILRLDETKANPKPALSTMRDQIKDILVAQRFDQEIKDARKGATIVLK